jgi:hypothetical protein
MITTRNLAAVIAVLIGIGMIYVFSMGPGWWGANHHVISWAVYRTIYQPIMAGMKHDGRVFYAMCWYCNLWYPVLME